MGLIIITNLRIIDTRERLAILENKIYAIQLRQDYDYHQFKELKHNNHLQ